MTVNAPWLRKGYLLVNALVLLVLIGCGEVPTKTELIGNVEEPTSEIEPLIQEDDNGSVLDKGSASRFAIYLVSQELSVGEISEIDLNDLPLDQAPILSVDDILEYTWESHEIKLVPAAYARLAKLERRALGNPGVPFVVCVGPVRLYPGMFWSSYSSVPYKGIVIDVYPAESNRSIRIQAGYPSPDWFAGEDLRDDYRIFESLEDAGLLQGSSGP